MARFAAFKSHLSYFPHSGSVLSELLDDVAPYTTSKGALQFAVDAPLPKALVKKLTTSGPSCRRAPNGHLVSLHGKDGAPRPPAVRRSSSSLVALVHVLVRGPCSAHESPGVKMSCRLTIPG